MAFSFGLVTAVLLLLFLWTLTETVPITVKVQDGLYTAFLGEFSSEIPCPGLEGGEAGLYLTSTSLSKKLWYRSLDLLTPGAAWKKITIAAEGKKGKVLKLYDGREMVRSTAVFWPAPEGKPTPFGPVLDGQMASMRASCSFHRVVTAAGFSRWTVKTARRAGRRASASITIFHHFIWKPDGAC